uniref:Uncharacterized protein n=1 Tax=Escherichia coli TaxID=562 RepID=A0A2S0T088_ECOLX|nr:hypothetical protein [Escherichia coli]
MLHKYRNNDWFGMVLLAVRIALQFFQKSRECQNKRAE